MDFLKEYGIKNEVIDKMLNSYDPVLIDVFLFDEGNVRKVIEYFQSLGIKVIDEQENYIIYEIKLSNIVENGQLSIKIFQDNFEDIVGNIMNETIKLLSEKVEMVQKENVALKQHNRNLSTLLQKRNKITP